ncbi:pyridoxal phosphate enzyme YggS family [Sulfuricaulis limicola]|uniref:Pyridoxal phosphate homeostasis protein n=1 Tax=Sulfuricaulis limicola TaxID=1620215 RepID=A0A1B4XFS5_9GAMM|nr:YggS family pyridoxal phosphate-dependent enzyme [Sulfuricaulis limicola]BAV33654.1 pyridoxal phosphate enzyme YggS family [Sulfuricaulis limicola]
MQDVNQISDAIASNLFRVRQSIADAARACTRSSDAIRLIAVSKGHPKEAIAAAMAAGQKDFGESTTQDALPKISQLANPSIDWHFIGHLQTNKARFIPGNFSWLHSLDSLELARKLSRRAAEQSATINILIEVNVSRDPKKHGLTPEALPDFIEKYLKENFPALPLRGLMTIGPHAAPEKEIRACFAGLRRLRDDYQRRFGLKNFTELSMGMSGDYIEAIQEGATMVRVGTAIFGERDYSK